MLKWQGIAIVVWQNNKQLNPTIMFSVFDKDTIENKNGLLFHEQKQAYLPRIPLSVRIILYFTNIKNIIIKEEYKVEIHNYIRVN